METSTEDTVSGSQPAEAPRLRQALEVCLLMVVAATALAHPLCLSDDTLNRVFDRMGDTGLFRQLLPWIACRFTPLILKESVFLTGMAALLFVFTCLKLRGQLLGVERSALGDGSGSWREWLWKPELWVLTTVVYFAISVSWSPVFQQSLGTLMLFAAGSALLLVALSVSIRRQIVVKFMVLTVLCGGIIATVAILQHLDRIPFLPPADDPRNRMSSLIGHNTGMSSWLMFPLSFSFYFLLTNRRMWVRVIAAAMAILFVLVILAAQSRAIWVLAGVMCIAAPWQIFRQMGRKFSFTWMLAGVAVLLALVLGLSLSPQTNPLARLPVSLEERVTGHILNLDQLRRETRLRIMVVSLSELFTRAPFFGTGLGSFAWEYPKAQGAFFTANPDTWLGTTTRRTDLAHNDYLQVLIETGLVGLLLVLGGMWALARESWNSYRSISSRYIKAQWWALAAPVAGVVVHGLVDFPFHVVPIAAVAIVSAALTTRLRSDMTQEHVDNDVTLVASTPVNEWRATRNAVLISVTLFAWLPWAWPALVGRVLVSDVHYNAGLAWLDDFRNGEGKTLQRRLAMLDRAQRLFREATITNVFNGEAYQGQVTAYVNRGAVLLHELQRMEEASAGTTITEPLKMAIMRDTQGVINVTDNQVNAGGLRYHYTYYALGRAWRLRWELEKGEVAPEDSEAYHNSIAALRQALDFNPADSMALRELSDLLGESQRTVDESQELQSLLLRTDPWSADELLLQPAIKLAREGEILTAKAMLEPIFHAYPKHPRVMLAQAWLAFYEAVWPPRALDNIEREEEYLQWRREKLAPARPVIEELPDTKYFQERKRQLRMLYAAAAGEIERANRLAHALVDEDMWNREARAVYYWTQYKMFGGGMQHEHSIEYYRTHALLTIYFMPPRKLGLRLGELAGREGLPEKLKITIPEMRRVLAFCAANEWWEFMGLFMPALVRMYPGDAWVQEMSGRAMRAGGA